MRQVYSRRTKYVCIRKISGVQRNKHPDASVPLARISHGSHGNCANKMAAASGFDIGSCTDLVSRLQTGPNADKFKEVQIPR
uniref:Uncharacterized protein n=1 Tax=Vespula pensylvanica TaxID=30213 RepID=A0A834NQN8_VESPE|nr:hypothetical protein H0235_012172 [Vespula pensylvanica]